MLITLHALALILLALWFTGLWCLAWLGTLNARRLRNIANAEGMAIRPAVPPIALLSTGGAVDSLVYLHG
jgi:hypothetical protein